VKALALLAVVACSHPPARPHDPDDERAGAIVAAHEEKHYWHFNGALDAEDAIDWIRFDLPAERAQFEIELRSDLPFEGEVYAADGTELAKLPAKINAATLIYVRVARGAKRSTGTYYLKARRGPIPDPPPVKLPECDRENFDASRPECKDKCDFKNPDESLQDCCALWWTRCTKYGSADCGTGTIWWVGDRLMVAMGLANGVHGRPRGQLSLDEREPKAKTDWEEMRRGRLIDIRAVNVESTRSEWEVVDPQAHEFDWLRKHAKRVRIKVPMNCPRGKPPEG
jgi:hypothetical protein